MGRGYQELREPTIMVSQHPEPEYFQIMHL